MGNWHISIQGKGAYHNLDAYDKDANEIMKKFVEALKAADQTIESATFTYGGKDDIG